MRSRDHRVDAFSLGALRFHVPLLIGVTVCVYAGWFELSRARAGHTVAWVYAFEWPGFAVVGIYIWWRMISTTDGSRPTGPTPASGKQFVAADDPGLAAWQQYLAQVQRDERGSDADAAS